MKNKVFISGSMAINKLPKEVMNSIDKIIEQNLEVLVGDASGIDTLVQIYCKNKNYHNLIVYSIFNNPRFIASNLFKNKKINIDITIRSKRKQQQEKDKVMTNDSEYSFVIWDSKSKGSYDNIIRGLDKERKVKVYLSKQNSFLNNKDVNEEKIESIYRNENGFTCAEVVETLHSTLFKRSQDLNNFLLREHIIEKNNNIYVPASNYQELFIIDEYRGRAKGVKFTNKFINFIHTKINENLYIQDVLL